MADLCACAAVDGSTRGMSRVLLEEAAAHQLEPQELARMVADVWRLEGRARAGW